MLQTNRIFLNKNFNINMGGKAILLYHEPVKLDTKDFWHSFLQQLWKHKIQNFPIKTDVEFPL